MKFTTALKVAAISAGIFAGSLYVIPAGSISSSLCQTDTKLTAEQCLEAEQQNWFKWFKGKSRSTQFHFVDLLELLSRLSPTK
ncbi:hypothetical protein [Rheinheimera maricola]|uniref:Secreted protein n=1 Tax=Rheinheimera maricola TaxID=2793282 RepID=A0ABS7X776_9GAMM|nr:hypothetical protein [Rheinheimera maricola]MBZ9611181.1 hypothetical protein [Rheinheimera maricola]